jgi:hypothetical protein
MEKLNIKYDIIIQRPQEFVITRPKSLHMGFNLGDNCCEAVNYVNSEWVSCAENIGTTSGLLPVESALEELTLPLSVQYSIIKKHRYFLI